MVKPVYVFRIRPDANSRLSIQVEVYRDANVLRRISRAEGRKRSMTLGLIGECLGVAEWRRGRKTQLFAIVRLTKEDLTMSTITHEAFHATARWAERRGLKAIPVSGEPSNINGPRMGGGIEEHCAKVHHTICRKIVVKLQQHKLLPYDKKPIHND